MVDDGRRWVVEVVLLKYRDYWPLGFVLLLLETFEDILNLLPLDWNRHRLHKVIITTVVLLFGGLVVAVALVGDGLWAWFY